MPKLKLAPECLCYESRADVTGIRVRIGPSAQSSVFKLGPKRPPVSCGSEAGRNSKFMTGLASPHSRSLILPPVKLLTY